MLSTIEQIIKRVLEKISINQNVIILALSYIGVIIIIDKDLFPCECCVYVFSVLCLVLFMFACCSVIKALMAYTENYCKKKQQG
jgi:hypothetical protein